MKKKYLLFLGLGLTTVTFGQQKVVAKKPNSTALSVDVTSVKKATPIVSKAEGDVLFSEQFNGSMNGWTTSGTDASVWQFDTDGPDGTFSATDNSDKIASTTNGNGFMIFDADLSNPAAPYVDRQGSLVSPVYDLTGRTSVSIRYQQAYRTCCSASFIPKLEVSVDGFATFTTYDVTEIGIAVNDFSGTTVKEVNINAFLAANSANLNNFQMRFNFDGISGASSHYFWQVDDVEIFEPFSFSLKANLSYWGSLGFWGPRLPYSMVPRPQIAPVTFSLIAENKGGVDQSDVVLGTSIPEGPFTNAGPQTLLPAFSIDTLDASATFTPTASLLMTYNPTFAVTSGNLDVDPTDNTLAGHSIEVTDSVYARDMVTVDGGTFNSGNGFEAGNIFDMYDDAKITSGSVFIRSTSNTGAQVYIKLYDLDPITRDFRFVAETPAHTITAAEKGTLITLNFDDVYDLMKDSSYLLVAGSFGDGGSTNDLVVATAGASEPQTSYYYDMTDATWYYTTGTPIVRMNLPNNAGVEENSNINGLNIYPNPAKDKVSVDFNLNNTAKVNINVTDLAGKVIFTKDLGTKTNGNHTFTLDASMISNGIYVMNVVTNGEVSAHKLVINK